MFGRWNRCDDSTHIRKDCFAGSGIRRFAHVKRGHQQGILTGRRDDGDVIAGVTGGTGLVTYLPVRR